MTRLAQQPENDIVEEEWTEGLLTIYHCPFDGTLPRVFISSTDFDIVKKPYAYCQKSGCPASHYAVLLEIWNQRGPHEDKVKHIDSNEPIFVLRAQDAFIQNTMKEWLALAQDRVINTSKFLSASADYQAMLKWQQENPTLVKIPD